MNSKVASLKENPPKDDIWYMTQNIVDIPTIINSDLFKYEQTWSGKLVNQASFKYDTRNYATVERFFLRETVTPHSDRSEAPNVTYRLHIRGTKTSGAVFNGEYGYPPIAANEPNDMNYDVMGSIDELPDSLLQTISTVTGVILLFVLSS